MAFISADEDLLTVLNLFGTDTREGQNELLEVMRGIIDSAEFEGWRSSTLFGGEEEPGTANYIQWRSVEDLQKRYHGEKFQNEIVPLFDELATSVRLLQTRVVFSRRHPSLEQIEISPDRDDYAVIVVMGVEPEHQQELVDLFAQTDEWVKTVPGYRSNSILQGLDETFVVNFAQWESKETYDAFHFLPESERPADVRKMRQRAGALLTSRDANTYRCVHTRSAAQQEAR